MREESLSSVMKIESVYDYYYKEAVMAYWLESQTCNPKVVGSRLGHLKTYDDKL